MTSIHSCTEPDQGLLCKAPLKSLLHYSYTLYCAMALHRRSTKRPTCKKHFIEALLANVVRRVVQHIRRADQDPDLMRN